jgi:hypothetical protein
MTNPEDLIGKVVIALTAADEIHGVGRVIGYQVHPTYLIEHLDGQRFSWVASLCKPAREDCKMCDGEGHHLPEPIGNFRRDLTGVVCKECAKREYEEMPEKVCPKCGGNCVMITESASAGVCNRCGYAWTDGYPCICGEKRGGYLSGSGHREECAMHREWYYTTVAQPVRR